MCVKKNKKLNLIHGSNPNFYRCFLNYPPFYTSKSNSNPTTSNYSSLLIININTSISFQSNNQTTIINKYQFYFSINLNLFIMNIKYCMQITLIGQVINEVSIPHYPKMIFLLQIQKFIF